MVYTTVAGTAVFLPLPARDERGEGWGEGAPLFERTLWPNSNLDVGPHPLTARKSLIRVYSRSFAVQNLV